MKIAIKLIYLNAGASLKTPQDVISGHEPSSEMLTPQSQEPE